MVNDIAALDLTDDEYTVVQSLIRNKYKATDADGNVVLRGKQKMLKMKEEFPFTDADGNAAFTVKAGGILDIAGDYTLIDDETDEAVVVLDQNYSLFTDTWKIRDPDTEALIATIESKSTLISVLRHFIGVAGLIPHAYEISDADGDHVGTIDGKFSLKDTYDVTIDDASDVPKEAIVAAAMVVDAIEGN
ncbi:hypothetical protein M0R89_09350 [Halorussus limi]|uniref:Uncharacterized protein n=1 Tax=Halorussus limi TaxID=2938695 RepID=A0A8U0HPY7_9EURY|nr:hypothetical protein [Halorussus limi]UPV72754.1 hypothetical protein M0R89_09350 [Halorussus limi]